MSHTQVVQELQRTFLAGKTRDIQWRIQQLKQIILLVTQNIDQIAAALKADLGWTIDGVNLLEIAPMKGEAQYALDHVKEWAKPTSTVTPLFLKPASTEIVHEPVGVVLIIGPWNYPIHLMVNPLIAAIAAGNCAILKPSEISANSSALLAKLIPKYLDTSAIRVVEGGVAVTTSLLKEPFNHYFYTGNTTVGKIVARAAAEQLAPVTLELGGKNPCVVDKDTNLSVAAHRIAWGKFTNNGQTCIAPDYLIVHPEVEQQFVEHLRKVLVEFYGPDPKQSPDYSKIVNTSHVKRVRALLDDKADNYELVVGGTVDEAERYFAPTILRKVSLRAKVMQEEIFGPVLPILDTSLFPASNFVESVINFLNTKPRSLSFYVFTSNSKTEKAFNSHISFGGGCVNDCWAHVVSPYTPFGGIGDSGQGSYHGKFGFDRLSHHKPILRNSTLLDPSIRYPPYSASRVALLNTLKEINVAKYFVHVGVIFAALLLAYFRNSFSKLL